VDGPPAATVPDDGRLALIREADGGEVRGLDTGVGERIGRGSEHRIPKLVRVVLDPSRPGKILGHLAIPPSARHELFVHDEAGCPGCPLVDRQEQRLVVRLAALPRS